MNTLDLIQHHNLILRPAMFSDGWIAGVFRGLTGHEPPHVLCMDGTQRQGSTIEEAVANCVAAIESKDPRLSPSALRIKQNAAIQDLISEGNHP